MFKQDAPIKRKLWALPAVAAGAVAVPLAGCGGGGSSSSSTAASPATSPGTTTTAAAGTAPCESSVTTSSNEAASTAQGDTPDNQQFLTFKNPTGGYAIKYP